LFLAGKGDLPGSFPQRSADSASRRRQRDNPEVRDVVNNPGRDTDSDDGQHQQTASYCDAAPRRDRPRKRRQGNSRDIESWDASTPQPQHDAGCDGPSAAVAQSPQPQVDRGGDEQRDEDFGERQRTK
jgi:hypothetical protein